MVRRLNRPLRLATVLGVIMYCATEPSMLLADEEDSVEQLGESVIRPAVRRELHKPTTEVQSSDEVPRDLTAATVEPSTNADRTEVIRERFSNRMVKVERHVAQDADGNFYNHGPWTEWDDEGKIVARGEYRNNKRQGKWFRWYSAEQAPLFAEAVLQGFEEPFGTEAEFTDGKLEGTWTVFDAKKRSISTWQFEKDQRNGRSVWYLPSGQVQQEVLFKNGQMDGDLLKLNADGKLVVYEKYIGGRRLAREVKLHAPGKKKSEGDLLYAKTYADVKYDWWNGTCEIIPCSKDHGNQRHGMWMWWYANGQKQQEGLYQYDEPIGMFTWWFANGQRQLQGEYTDGQQQGKFVWWHQNGQKKRQGEFSAGVPIGNWMEWHDDGRMMQTEYDRNRIVDDMGSEQIEQQPAPVHAKPQVRVSSRDRVQR